MGLADIFAVHVAIHGVASDRHDAADGIGFGVGRAFIDLDRLVVRKEQALLNQRGVGCGREYRAPPSRGWALLSPVPTSAWR